jgi:hypothetical protein
MCPFAVPVPLVARLGTFANIMNPFIYQKPPFGAQIRALSGRGFSGAMIASR